MHYIQLLSLACIFVTLGAAPTKASLLRCCKEVGTKSINMGDNLVLSQQSTSEEEKTKLKNAINLLSQKSALFHEEDLNKTTAPMSEDDANLMVEALQTLNTRELPYPPGIQSLTTSSGISFPEEANNTKINYPPNAPLGKKWDTWSNKVTSLVDRL